MTIGEKIRAIRKVKGFSQEMLQQKSGIQRNFISLIENNHRGVSYRTLEKIANALSVTVGEITDYHPPVYRSQEQLTLPIPQVAEATATDRYLGRRRWDEQYLSVPIIDEKLLCRRLSLINRKRIKDYVLVQPKWLPEPREMERYRCFWAGHSDRVLPPLIAPGSLVCVDCGQRDPARLLGKIVAFYDDDKKCSIRKLQLKGKNIIGLPLDTKYSLLIIPASKRERLIGRVIWYLSLLPG
jgi:transcriptional regulator with XRE-family HTH domain